MTVSCISFGARNGAGGETQRRLRLVCVSVKLVYPLNKTQYWKTRFATLGPDAEANTEHVADVRICVNNYLSSQKILLYEKFGVKCSAT